MKMTGDGMKHYRVIHSIFPPKNLFDTVSAHDALLLGELEGYTSDRLMRWRESVSTEDARFGDGWGPVMASFCYIRAGRFNTDAFGCYYSANSPHTAIKEWSFHAAKVWNEFGYRNDAHAMVRCYVGNIAKPLVDVRNNAQVHAADSYHASQALGISLRKAGEYGVCYRSVRHKDGICFGLFRPPATTEVIQSAHFTVNWDGKRKSFTEYAEVTAFTTL